MKKLIFAAANVWATGLLIFFLTAGTARGAKLLVGYSGVSADLSYLWIANEAGLFRKYGVEVVPVYFNGGRPLLQALIANDIQFGMTSGITSARAIIAGADLVIVAGHINKLTYTLFTSREITKPEQLRGSVMAISGFGTTSHASTVLALRKMMVPLKDVALVQIGDASSRFAALQAGSIQGVVISPPLTLMAKQRGFNPMLDLTQAEIPWSQELVLANGAVLKKEPDVAKNFMKGFIDGLRLWHADKTRTTELLAKFMKIDIKTNKEAIEEAYTFMEHATERKPYPSFDGLKTQLDMIAETDPRAKTVRPEQLVDLRIIQELDKSGFIDALYKQPASSARTTVRN